MEGAGINKKEHEVREQAQECERKERQEYTTAGNTESRTTHQNSSGGVRRYRAAGNKCAHGQEPAGDARLHGLTEFGGAIQQVNRIGVAQGHGAKRATSGARRLLQAVTRKRAPYIVPTHVGTEGRRQTTETLDPFSPRPFYSDITGDQYELFGRLCPGMEHVGFSFILP